MAYRFLSIGVVATVLMVSAASAANRPGELNDAENGLSYVQTASKILVNIKAGQDVAITFTALPQLSLCGQITDIPVAVDYNNEEVNIRLKDYSFVHPVGQEKPDCGPANKAATAHVLIERSRLQEYSVKNIRMFYNGWIETYRINLTAEDVVVTPPTKPKFFVPDERQQKAIDQAIVPPQWAAPAPPVVAAPAQAPAAATPTAAKNLLILTTGDAKKDFEFMDDIAVLAATRGLAATTSPYIFSDGNGQFYFQLGFTPELPIGAIVRDGVRWPVLARRAP